MSYQNQFRQKFSDMTIVLLRSFVTAWLIVVLTNTLILANPSGTMTFAQVEKRHHELVTEARDILLSQGDWNKARKLLEEARNLSVTTARGLFPYRSKEADFYWAWILCQTPAEQEEGRKLLDKTLQADLWPVDKQAKIKKVRQDCGHDSGTKPPPVEQKVEEKFILAAIQKGGKWSQPVRLESREALPHLPWEQNDTAKAAVKKAFKSYNVIASKPFLVAGPFPPAYLTELAETVLDPYFEYLARSLGIEYDWGVLYVFVSSDHTKFASATDALYRVMTEDRTPIEMAIAFSDLPNNTMMAICGKDASNCTSFAHELFHLLNAKTFDDAPWWLYEGMAELFESGDLRDGAFHARAGWRKEKAAMDKLDTKAFVALLSISKNDPELYRPPGAEVAMSRVRFFCRYLGEKGVLLDVYDGLRRRDWRESAADPAGIGVLVKTLNKNSLDEVNADFRKWFERIVLPEPGAPGP